MIMDYSPNGISADSVLQVDQVLMVPGGRPERVPAVAVRPQTGTTAAKTKTSTTSAGGSKTAATTKKVKPKVEAQSKPAVKTAAKTTAVKPAAKTAASNTPKVGTGRMMWPVQGRITQYFSSRHNGLDLAIAAGTPIHAADSGRIIWSGWRTDGLGNCVMIDHGNGLITVYGHMIRKPPVYVGQYVSKGDIIGNIGSTGRSTGPHVHFMVKQGTGRNYRNPLAYLSSR
jgi:murein DD-endopeptidase MepM/ murein hydrolase activator NlpD